MTAPFGGDEWPDLLARGGPVDWLDVGVAAPPGFLTPQRLRDAPSKRELAALGSIGTRYEGPLTGHEERRELPVAGQITWDTVVDLYKQFGQADDVPKVVVIPERQWEALRRAVSPTLASEMATTLSFVTAPFGGLRVVVAPTPRTRRVPVRRTGPLLGCRARHAGALRVARLQRRVDRRAARRRRPVASVAYAVVTSEVTRG
ncbi:hypothetical protein [Actinosynnema sp. NPDC023587]|uniref:hypothetical protein n=1 Tax=Actinosynnema sp. NPDC023587 TaxID=3154695 RepID=UPI0033D20FD9